MGTRVVGLGISGFVQDEPVHSDLEWQLLRCMDHHRVLIGHHSSAIDGDVRAFPYTILVLGSPTLGTNRYYSRYLETRK